MKKHYLITAALMLAASVPSTVSAALVHYGNRDFYGFFLNSDGYTNGDMGEYGFTRQKFSAVNRNELLLRFNGSVGVYAAAAVDGVYYYAPYIFQSSLEPPTALPMMKYNLYDNSVEELGEWCGDDSSFKLWDMTYDRKNDRLLAVGNSMTSGSCVYEVNREDGSLTKLRSMNPGGGVLACDAQGRVLTITTMGELYQIDMNSQTRQVKLAQLDYSYLDSHQSLEFDFTDGKLYWASNCLENPNGGGSNKTWLVEIALPVVGPEMDYTPDLPNENSAGDQYISSTVYKQTMIGEMGSNARFLGMYIPYSPGGFDAPGNVTDIKTESSADGTWCRISFKAPSKTFGGNNLAGIDGYDIYRDGARIYTKKGALAAGEEAVYEDKDIPKSGEYRYDIVCYTNTAGDGVKSPAFAYVGFDRPAAVTNIKVAVNDDFRGAEITWDAPVAGAKGGTFNPAETRYDVMRLPDNVKVAENLVEPKFSDKINRLLRYTYKITAKNNWGESVAESDYIIAGRPVDEFPVDEGFDNPTATLLSWDIVDNNKDTQTWIFSTDFTHGVFGDYETAASYILSSTTVPSDVDDADDWLISPPIVFGDDEYAVELQIRSMTNEHFTVYVGDKNVPAAMTQEAGSFTLNRPEYGDDNLMLFQKYVVKLPESVRNTTKSVGICLDTKLPGDLYGFVQLGNVCIDSYTTLGVAGIETEAGVSFDSDSVNVSGDYKFGCVYNMAGQAVRSLNGASTDISDLPAGVYVIVVDNRSFKLVK